MQPRRVMRGGDGLPVISYYDDSTDVRDLKVVQCGDVTCSDGNETISTVDAAGMVGLFPSITVGSDGLPVIAYYDLSNGVLKFVHCNDPSCTGNDEVSVVVNNGEKVGERPTITIGIDGLPLIAYEDDTLDKLKVAHCPSPFCVDHFRRR